MKIKILVDVPSFVWVDMSEYPAMKQNEIHEFPEKLAKLLIDRKIGREIND